MYRVLVFKFGTEEHNLTTVNDLLVLGERAFLDNRLFFGHGTDNAWDEAVQLLCHVLGESPDTDRSLLTREVAQVDAAAIKSLFARRVEKRIPAAYLTGIAWFCGRRFEVDRRVIIPRSPFAELIRAHFEPWLELPPLRILDLCCGSGCIGISAALEFPEAEVVLSDISADALAVARANIALHGVGDRVSVVLSDGFKGLKQKEPFDLVLCNPPYVDAEDIAAMPDEFRHEPGIALASGVDGLKFTRMLLNEAAGYLTEEGLLFGEVGNSMEALVAAYPETSFDWVQFEDGGHGVYCLNRGELSV